MSWCRWYVEVLLQFGHSIFEPPVGKSGFESNQPNALRDPVRLI